MTNGLETTERAAEKGRLETASSLQRSSFWSHMIRFMMYNCLGALLPVGIAWLLRCLSGVYAVAGAYAQEWLFFAVMISATSLGDLTDETNIIGSNPRFQIAKGTLLMGCIFVAAIYGTYQYDVIVGSGNLSFRSNIGNAAVVLAAALFVLSTTVEVYIAKIRAEPHA
jgi:cellulose synthase/poly-beta-1,6-N-acetylglucosamine synthase-like glycosyltransferase